MTLDKIDLAILRLLQTQGRIANQELASMVGLSPSPCSRRVKALEEAGYIRSYAAILAPEMFDLHLTVHIQVRMERHTQEVLGAFEAQISRYPEVLECSLLTGSESDYLLKVMVRDMQSYRAFLLDKLTSNAHIAGVHSSFVLKQVKNHGPLPLPEA
ncbi:Lrp/AsnC family transcriptional regulator [Shewanella sp. GXUN23E]|uniref:Lrp/AsnC family transcriptional regulator n=1 Tax=Shewanella sp. GXUN23E TaxID=3422498 RepID=UPI003D7DA431